MLYFLTTTVNILLHGLPVPKILLSLETTELLNLASNYPSLTRKETFTRPVSFLSHVYKLLICRQQILLPQFNFAVKRD